MQIEYRLNTMVMDISPRKIVTAMNREEGLFEIQAKAVILAMGCRGALQGRAEHSRIPSGGDLFCRNSTEACQYGRSSARAGSRDPGVRRHRTDHGKRMTLEGAKVKAVAELMPYSGGLKRNIVQCLDDYGIPLKLSHTVVDIKGKERLEGVTLAEVDSTGKPISGTEDFYSCDTLLCR